MAYAIFAADAYFRMIYRIVFATNASCLSSLCPLIASLGLFNDISFEVV